MIKYIKRFLCNCGIHAFKVSIVDFEDCLIYSGVCLRNKCKWCGYIDPKPLSKYMW